VVHAPITGDGVFFAHVAVIAYGCLARNGAAMVNTLALMLFLKFCPSNGRRAGCLDAVEQTLAPAGLLEFTAIAVANFIAAYGILQERKEPLDHFKDEFHEATKPTQRGLLLLLQCFAGTFFFGSAFFFGHRIPQPLIYHRLMTV
jgi:hypothetical protein